jgi:hypothetical protein
MEPEVGYPDRLAPDIRKGILASQALSTLRFKRPRSLSLADRHCAPAPHRTRSATVRVHAATHRHRTGQLESTQTEITERMPPTLVPRSKITNYGCSTRPDDGVITS